MKNSRIDACTFWNKTAWYWPLTISCLILLASIPFFANGQPTHLAKQFQLIQGAIVRGDTSQKQLSLVFTGHQYADGGMYIRKTLKKHRLPASFFFTGDFYNRFPKLVKRLIRDGHYLGPHSDQHLLYCDWSKRDSVLVTEPCFRTDLLENYKKMARFGIDSINASYFLPPYEWYNDTISAWTQKLGLELINITYGTRSHADYTTPEMPNYTDSQTIFDSIIQYEARHPAGLNGFILLIHIGTAPERIDKFYLLLDELILILHSKGYSFLRIDEMLTTKS